MSCVGIGFHFTFRPTSQGLGGNQMLHDLMCLTDKMFPACKKKNTDALSVFLSIEQ